MMKALPILLVAALSLTTRAQDRRGTIQASQISCPESGLQAKACYALQISCPDIDDYTAYVKIVGPQFPLGTVIFTTGGDSNNLYEAYDYGAVTIQDLVASRYTAVELTFGEPFSDAPGWQHNAEGQGVRAASCRYATVVEWVSEQNLGGPLCATGNSAGGEQIGEGLAHYDLGNYLVFAEMTSGPPFSRVDWGCLNNVQPAIEYCSGGKVGMGVGLGNAMDYIDPAYPGPWCSDAMETQSTEHEAQFLNDSVTSPDAVLRYPSTRVRFLFGGQDKSSAIRQGLQYQSQIMQSTSVGCVQDAPHSIPDVLDGAETIASDLINNCHY